MNSFRPLHAWSLKTKFALSSGALMFFFTVAFTSWMLQNIQSDVHDSVVDARRALVRSTADDIDAKVELRRDAMTTIATLLAQAAPRPGLPMTEFFRPRPVLSKMFDVVVVVDADGRIVQDFPPATAQALVGQDVSGRDFFRQVARGAPITISAPFRSSTGSTPIIAFAAPLRAASGRFEGALVGILSTLHGNFLGDLGQVRIGKEGYFALMERNQSPLIVIDREPGLAATPAPSGASHPIMAAALRGQEGTLEGRATTGVEALRTFRPLRSVPWVLVAVYPTAEAFAGLRQRQRAVLEVGAFIFLLAFAGAWLMTGRLLRPLSRLQAFISQHATSPELVMLPETLGSGELVALARAYNAQAASRIESEKRLQSSETRVRDVMDNIPASIAYLDKHRRYAFANARLLEQLGETASTIVGRSLDEVRDDKALAEMAPHVARALGGHAASFEGQELFKGRIRFVQTHLIPDPDPDAAGSARGFYKMSFDITPLKEAQGRQMAVEQRLRAITDHLPALIAHVDAQHRFDFLNQTFKTWLDIDPVRAIGRPMEEVLGPDLQGALSEAALRGAGRRSSDRELEVRTLAGRRTLRVEYLPDIDPSDAVAGFYCFISDITELKDVQLRLDHQIHTDGLTGLGSRLQFERSCPHVLERCRISGLGIALLFLDVDHFKQVNDRFGHGAGDQLLREFGRRLRESVRGADLVARLGGDEFVVILEGLHFAHEASRVAEVILRRVREPFALGKVTLNVTTTIGIAFCASVQAETSAELLLEQADAALYRAKLAGRNGFEMAAP